MSTSSLVSRFVLATLFTAMVASTTLLAQSPASLAQPAPVGQLSVGGAPAVPIYAFSSTVSVSGPGGGAGAVILTDISVGKLADAQSTSLFSAIVRGLHIPNVRIEVHQNGKATAIYELGDVVVTSLASASTGESVAFNFARLTLTVAGQSFCWDTASSSSC